jgi:hypothetical protein
VEGVRHALGEALLGGDVLDPPDLVSGPELSTTTEQADQHRGRSHQGRHSRINSTCHDLTTSEGIQPVSAD